MRIDMGSPTFWQRIQSTGRMVGRLPWLVRNLAVKIALRRDWPLVSRALGHTGSEYPY